MLVSNGSRLLYRAIATYTNAREKASMMTYLKDLKSNACAFDNPTEANVLIVDFDQPSERNAFSEKFTFETHRLAA